MTRGSSNNNNNNNNRAGSYHQASSSRNNGNNNQNNNVRFSSTPSRTTRAREVDACCSVKFVKNVLHIFNIIFFLSGLAVGSFAVWNIFWKHKYISLLTSHNYAFASYGLFLSGVLAIIGGVFGWCGVWRENRAILLCYMFILILVFLLETTVGSMSYVYDTQVEKELNRTLNETFLNNYGVHKTRTAAIDHMQQEFKCCGAIRYEDWREGVWLRSRRKDLLMPKMNRVVPDSCCFTKIDLCGQRDHPSNIPYTGCIYQMTDEIREQLNYVGAVGLGFCGIEIFGLILSSALYIKLKRIYEDD